MKSITITILFGVFCHFIVSSQSLELETTNINERTMAILKFPTDNPQTANSLKIQAGSVALSETELASWGGSYTATPGYGGYGGVTNLQNGVIIRSSASTGQIKFITGGIVVSNNTRMTINEIGNVAIGTASPLTKLHVQNGDIFLNEINRGVIMKSPNGNCWKLQVTNTGSPTFLAVGCPDAQN